MLRGEAPTTALHHIDLADVLGRPIVPPDVARCREFVAGRRVLITGAAGSIGQEVARQVAQLDPAQLIALDVNETGLFDLQQEILAATPSCDLRPVIASVTNRRRVTALFARYRPEIVFHVAAFKHVPLMEEHPEEAVMVNVVGTFIVADAAAGAAVDRFVLVSSDKAVHPSSVMGATKRVAELVVRAVARDLGLSACSVRFGNVLGSRGSVVPTFARQIAAGGPVTVTDPRMQRFFMTIPEAASLIVQAGAFGDRDAIYVLDMGEEISIVQLAETMIRLSGRRVGEDIEIVFTGLRPGEKLREELAHQTESLQPTSHPKIHRLTEPRWASCVGADLIERVAELRLLALYGDHDAIRASLFATVGSAGGEPVLAAAAPDDIGRVFDRGGSWVPAVSDPVAVVPQEW